MKSLRTRRHFVQLCLGELRQSPARVRTGERGAAGAQGIDQSLDRGRRCSARRLVYFKPDTLNRNLFVEQPPSAQNFCIVTLASNCMLGGKLGIRTSRRGCAFASDHVISPLARCLRGRPRPRRGCGCERGASNASSERKMISLRRPT
jgi:hypothetical protein